MSDQRNLILAAVLTMLVIGSWQFFVAQPKLERERARLAEITEQQKNATPTAGRPVAPAPTRAVSRAEAAAATPRLPIDSDSVTGSINLTGARFDDLLLDKYRETVAPGAPPIELLSPSRGPHGYYAEFGWLAPQSSPAGTVPDADTLWRVTQGDRLAPGRDVTLSYDNGSGLVFTRHVAMDENYMFTITDRVENRGAAASVLYPYGLVSRHNVPQTTHYWVVHEGYIGVAGGTLQDESYDSLGSENETRHFDATGGWVGITDKYWMAAIIPPQTEQFTGTYKAYDENSVKAYQSDYMLKPRTVTPGAAQEVTHRLFAGAKVVSVIEDYNNNLNISRFDLAVDWGWFFFLTKPIFLALDWLFKYVGNFGVAILIFTVFVKIVFFPLANASYKSMSKMKKLQPEMERLRERFKDDKMAQQQAVMELYKKEGVNPLAGCLPMLIQIPVFFSLYKVLFVTIEMRHAPFFGWIRDLSALEPTSIFNLFGLLPYALPEFLMIGVFPILMGITMWMQTNLNPPPADPMQARIFAFMPLVFTFMLAAFPAGLVIYWTWNNILSIAQQIYIMKRMGTPIDMFDRLRGMTARLRRGEPAEKPAGPPD